MKRTPILLKQLFIQTAVAPLFLLAAALPASALTFDFSSGSGGFAGNGGWSYTGENWVNPGQPTDLISTLNSPVIRVLSDGPIRISLTHIYNTEEPIDFYDGGVLQLSVNSGGFTTATPVGGYPVATDLADGCDALDFAPCFGGDSGGMVSDTFDVSGLSAGDSVVIRLLHGSDASFTSDADDWTILSLAATNVEATTVPLPPGLPMLAAGLGLLWLRRRRKF